MLDQSYFHTAQFSSIEHKKRFIDYNFFSCGNRQKIYIYIHIFWLWSTHLSTKMLIRGTFILSRHIGVDIKVFALLNPRISV